MAGLRSHRLSSWCVGDSGIGSGTKALRQQQQRCSLRPWAGARLLMLDWPRLGAAPACTWWSRQKKG